MEDIASNRLSPTPCFCGFDAMCLFTLYCSQSASSVPVPELATNQRCRFPVEIDKVARGLNFRKLLGQRCERFIHLEIRFENGRQYSRMISIFVFVELKMLRRGFSQRSSMDLRFTGFWITCALTMLSITGRFQVGYISQFLP